MGMLRLFSGLLVLVVGLAEIGTATAQTVANGRNVTSVQTATGLFTMIGSQRWLERGDDGKTFNFVEDRRDEDRRVEDRRGEDRRFEDRGDEDRRVEDRRVEDRRDEDRRVEDRRDEDRRDEDRRDEDRRDKWHFRAAPQPQPPPAAGNPQGFANEVSGRNVTSVQVATGLFTMIGPQRWLERRNDGKTFNFVEVRRDKWSVYLLDPSRGVNLQIDLRKKQIFYSDPTFRRRTSYPIVGATAGHSQPQPEPPIAQPAPPQPQPEPPIALPAPPPPPPPEAGFADKMLTAHNKFRAKHGAQELTWSADLAASAQTWANQCKLNHPPNRAGFGENIAWGTTKEADTVAMWYNEVAKYDFTKPGFNPATGHFTQVVWKGSTQLGCGMAMGCPGAFGGGYWVCRYAPPGNIGGAFPENVAPTK